MQRSTELRLRIEALDSFQVALGELLSVVRFQFDSWGLDQGWEVADGQEARAGRLKAEVDTLAGPAAISFAEAGVIMSISPPGTTAYTDQINPAQAWGTIFKRSPMFSPDDLMGCCHQASGILRQMHTEAVEREKGIVGWIARFVRLPQRIREAAGVAPGTFGGRTATGFGVFLQAVLVTIVGGLTVAGLVAAFGWS